MGLLYTASLVVGMAVFALGYLIFNGWLTDDRVLRPAFLNLLVCCHDIMMKHRKENPDDDNLEANVAKKISTLLPMEAKPLDTVRIVKINRCGDGTCSTTDRVVVELGFSDNPTRNLTKHRGMKNAILKCILLPWYLRLGASPKMIAKTYRVGRKYRFIQTPLYRLVNWYTYYLPHAPDSLYINEILFYKHIRPDLTIEVPEAYGVFVDPKGAKHAALIEDLRERDAHFPNATEEFTLKQITGLLRVLARLHAQFWESPRFEDDLAWLPTPRSGGMYDLFTTLGKGIIKDHVNAHQFEQDLLAPLGLSVDEMWVALEKTDAMLCEAPVTLCHGDTHIQNTYILPGDKMGLLDFQLCLKGSWVRDVSYILATSMSPRVRRKHEKDLMRKYLAFLKEFGVPDESRPNFEGAWEKYRRAVVWGLVIGWLICPPNNYGVKVWSANVSRLVQTCIDLDSFGAHGVHPKDPSKVKREKDYLKEHRS